ncbi:hypothetical protein [Mesorhizobium sp. CN2-181]|uniref:hypothetical protein n=1 Tax=Mesorhizobium yinganensis TaxID=3157707 RepID=UPI0032B8144E
MSGRLIACAAVFCVICFIALKSAAGAGVPPVDLVLAIAAATLVLALASAGFALSAMLRSRRAHDEVVRVARSVDAAIRDLSAEIRRNQLASGEPEHDAAHPVQEIILTPADEPSDEAPEQARPPYKLSRLAGPTS